MRDAIRAMLRFRRWGVLLALLLTAAAWPLAGEVRFDRRIESMFAADDPLLPPFAQLKRTFGGDRVVLVAYDDAELWSLAGLNRVRTLQAALAGGEGIEAVVSPLDTPLKDGILLPVGAPVRDLLTGLLLGEDRRTVGLLCFLYPATDARATIPSEEIVARVRAAAATLQPGAVTVGEPAMVADGFAYLEADGRTLGTLTTLLMGLVILVGFRSLRWMLVPLSVVQAAVLWTRAAVVLLGLRLSMVSSMLTAMITVVGVGTVVHLMIRFREQQTAGRSAERALRRALLLVAAPIVWSIATDIVGFGALASSKVGPVQTFGWMTALGAAMTLLAVVLLLPGGALIGSWDAWPAKAYGEGLLGGGLDRLVRSLERHTTAWGVVCGLFCAVCIAGYPFLEVETDFTRNFRADTPIAESYRFVETRLGGAGVWDVFVPAPTPLDEPYLARVRRFEQRLRTEIRVTDDDGRPRPGLTKTLSLVDVLDAAGGSLPGNFMPLGVKLSFLEATAPPLHRALLGVDPESPTKQAYYRIMLRSLERQSTAAKEAILSQAARIAAEEFPGEARTTGFFVLLSSLIDRLLTDQWRTFGLATLGIAAALWTALRNRIFMLTALVPNAAPIFVVLGSMGHLGWKINMGTVMIAAVSMGLSVDSSLHYLTELGRRLRSGVPLKEALLAAHGNVGKAMIFSSLAFAVGFLALSGSRFMPTVYFGVLTSLSMLGGLAGNLVILPLLLLCFRRRLEAEFRPPIAENA